jgi:hypothetical protein
MDQNSTSSSRAIKFTSDVDIDFADRQQILNLIPHVGASILTDRGQLAQHNTGVYVTEIPKDLTSNRSTIDYKQAESRGYIKLDFLNVGLYQQVKSEQHLNELLDKEPPWHRLYEAEFCSQLIHIGNHYDTLIKMPEAVNSIPRLAMFLAVIRPAKRHLIGLPWNEVAKTVWTKPDDNSYYFKKSHSVSYAHLVVVNMNLADLTNQCN